MSLYSIANTAAPHANPNLDTAPGQTDISINSIITSGTSAAAFCSATPGTSCRSVRLALLPPPVPQPTTKKGGRSQPRTQPKKKDWIRQRIQDKQQDARLGDLLDGLGLDDADRDDRLCKMLESVNIVDTAKEALHNTDMPMPAGRRNGKSAFQVEAEKEWREHMNERRREGEVAVAARRGVSVEVYRQQKDAKYRRKVARREQKRLQRSEKRRRQSESLVLEQGELAEEWRAKRKQNMGRATHENDAQNRAGETEHVEQSESAGGGIELEPLGDIDTDDAML